MSMPEGTAESCALATEAELRAQFAEPNDYVKRRQLNRLERHSRNFIARSPFLVIGSVHPARGVDVSPRGDAPGFVQVLDDHTLAIPDRPGNNRLDTLSNILADAAVGLLFVIPGIDEMLRVNGNAMVTSDPDLLAASEVDGRRPKLMIRVAVREVFLHCGKAVKRSQLWGHEYRIERASFPTLAQMTADQIGSPDRLDEIAAKVTENYVTRMY